MTPTTAFNSQGRAVAPPDSQGRAYRRTVAVLL